MPPGAWRYTLVGITDELDWKPLVFIKPLPPFRVCSACGLVRRRMALMPCPHTLCKDCYEQSVSDGALTCPRDGCRYELPADVAWEEFHPHQLLELQVKCVNEERGCGHVMMAAEISTHLKHQCEHHATCCPVCSDTILCKSICAHLRSGCDTRAAPSASQLEEQSQLMDATQILAPYKGTLQSEVGKMKACLGRLISDTKVLCDRLSGLSCRISTFDEKEQIRHRMRLLGLYFEAVPEHAYVQESGTGRPVTGAREIEDLEELKKQLSEGIALSFDTLMNGTRELFATAEEAAESLLLKFHLFLDLSSKAVGLIQNNMARGRDNSGQSHEILADVSLPVEEDSMDANNIPHAFQRRNPPERVVEPPPSFFEFFVKDVNALYNSAREDNFACYGSRRVYLSGYCVTPGICVVHTKGILTLHIGIQLHMGVLDDTVRWPFKQKIKMTVLHPNGRDELAVEVREFNHLMFVQRPSQSNNPCFYLTPSLNLTNLIDDGYAAGDQLRLLYEMFP